MRPVRRITPACVFAFGVILAAGPRPATAQGPIGSLGGYGAMAGTGPSAGSGSLAPFSGRFGAVTPSGMGGSGSLSFTRPSAMMGGNRPSYAIGSMGGGMGSASGGMGQAFLRRPFTLQPLGPAGRMGSGVGMPTMTGSRGMGVMAPNFGYPFRQPPSLVPPSSSGAGMSM